MSITFTYNEDETWSTDALETTSETKVFFGAYGSAIALGFLTPPMVGYALTTGARLLYYNDLHAERRPVSTIRKLCGISVAIGMAPVGIVCGFAAIIFGPLLAIQLARSFRHAKQTYKNT